jgi:hypothetical protein
MIFSAAKACELAKVIATKAAMLMDFFSTVFISSPSKLKVVS